MKGVLDMGTVGCSHNLVDNTLGLCHSAKSGDHRRRLPVQQQEGVIKFRLDFTEALPLTPGELAELQTWRAILYRHRLIGQEPARYGGYGYGNLSHRLPPYAAPSHHRTFVISGSQTGDLAELGPEHYAVVEACYSEENRIVARGPIRPSSESLTHGAVYDLDSAIRCVLHVHSPEIWQQAAGLALPITDAAVPYGSPEMAAEVARLYAETDLQVRGIFSMGGHEDGIVAFGPTAQAAGDVLMEVWHQAAGAARS
jgi:ribulose-5-phosphate 4-epimerase/fuculose-1-phosphate aldolase